MKKLIAFSTALLMISSLSSSLVFGEEAAEKAPDTAVSEETTAAADDSAEKSDDAAAEDTAEKADDAAAEDPEDKADPTDWHLSVDKAAEAVMTNDTENREYSVFVINPGGEKRGGTDKWDVQFRKRTFSIVEGHEYTVTYRISASFGGSYYTKIGNLKSETVGEATAGEVWHNQFGISTIKSYVEGTVQEDAETSYGNAWSNQAISKGDTLNVTCNFTAIASLPEAEWTFFLGGAGSTSATDCFAPETKVIFSNLTLTDNTTGEVLVSSYPFINSGVKGDIDGNGTADITDLSLMCLAKVGEANLDDAQISNCDVNESGAFDMADIAHFKRFLSGLMESL